MPASEPPGASSPVELAPDYHYVVISSDSHAGADILDYKPYLESKWHDEFDAWAAAYGNPWDFVDPRLDKPGFDFTAPSAGTRPAACCTWTRTASAPR
jgi:hypothetical protein